MKNVGWWLGLGMGVAAAAAVGTSARGEGLAGLDDKLNSTGRIGTYTPHAAIAPATDAGVPATGRDPAPALTRDSDGPSSSGAHAALPVGVTELDVRPTDDAVAACRVEVARRRKLPPAKIAAGTVVVRFTIDRSGRVHDAEALSAADTDLEVAACAKRVLSQWVFSKRARDGIVVERTYRFTQRP
jgi:TonB family protein